MTWLRERFRALWAREEVDRALILDRMCDHQDVGACVDCENRFICESGF